MHTVLACADPPAFLATPVHIQIPLPVPHLLDLICHITIFLLKLGNAKYLTALLPSTARCGAPPLPVNRSTTRLLPYSYTPFFFFLERLCPSLPSPNLAPFLVPIPLPNHMLLLLSRRRFLGPSSRTPSVRLTCPLRHHCSLPDPRGSTCPQPPAAESSGYWVVEPRPLPPSSFCVPGGRFFERQTTPIPPACSSSKIRGDP
jgi:hypothetical protein